MSVSIPLYKRSWFNWLVLLLVTAGLGWWFYEKGERPFDISFKSSLEVTRSEITSTELADGTNVIENIKDGYKIKVPKRFNNNVAKDKFNYYTADSDCKLSFGTVARTKSLAEFLDGYNKMLDGMTIIKEEISYLNNEKTRAIYTLETEETGFSEVYYEDLGDHFVQIYIYSEKRDKPCYDEINNLTILKNK